MQPKLSLVDWRNAAAYAPLLRADRSLFAWEWLRRDPSYHEAAIIATAGRSTAGATVVGDSAAGRWGLHVFEAPQRTVPEARPVWRRELLSHVLCAEAVEGGASEDRFDLRRFNGLATLVGGLGEAEHLLLCDGYRTLRLDIVAGTLCGAPVLLRYRLAGLKGLADPLRVLRQLLALSRAGHFSRSTHPPEARAARWISALRALDALAAGASQREIAGELLSADAAVPRWRVQAPSTRSRVQRLVRDARRMAAGNYLALLKGGQGDQAPE